MSRPEGENSPTEGEGSMSTDEAMSPRHDVLKMQSICEAIADLLAAPGDVKARTRPVRSRLGVKLFSWNRINEFLRAKARRVDSWEMDHARAQLAALKAEAEQREAAEHVDWLARTLASYRASPDPYLRRPEISALERTLAAAGLLDRPLGSGTAPQGDD